MADKRSFYSRATVAEPVIDTEPQLPKLAASEQTAESFLAPHIRSAREELESYFEKSKQLYISQSDKYYSTEREVTSTLSSLHDKRETLFPNGLYVLTGFLFGSVVARKRGLFVKTISPVAFGLTSFKIFLPNTFDLTFGFVHQKERENLPDVYNKQVEIINKAEELMNKSSQLAQEQEKSFWSYFQNGKKFVADWTGLNVDQVVSGKK
ncbi:Mic26 protein [Martiniozyma asiatica (nom. inval.)]|nr:Mic26 protein [Martiniozyma asiatica]